MMTTTMARMLARDIRWRILREPERPTVAGAFLFGVEPEWSASVLRALLVRAACVGPHNLPRLMNGFCNVVPLHRFASLLLISA